MRIAFDAQVRIALLMELFESKVDRWEGVLQDGFIPFQDTNRTKGYQNKRYVNMIMMSRNEGL